jgi:hypothetical protein
MRHVPDLDWPNDLYRREMADELAIEDQDNAFWEDGDTLAHLGDLASGIPVIRGGRATCPMRNAGR